MVVAQLVEWSLPTPEGHGSNLIIAIVHFSPIEIEKDAQGKKAGSALLSSAAASLPFPKHKSVSWPNVSWILILESEKFQSANSSYI